MLIILADDGADSSTSWNPLSHPLHSASRGWGVRGALCTLTPMFAFPMIYWLYTIGTKIHTRPQITFSSFIIEKNRKHITKQDKYWFCLKITAHKQNVSDCTLSAELYLISSAISMRMHESQADVAYVLIFGCMTNLFTFRKEVELLCRCPLLYSGYIAKF